MKQVLLVLLFLPLQFISQAQTNALIPKNVARSEKIKSVQATTVFITTHASDKPDTGVVNTEEYDLNGNIIRTNYSNTLDKNNYSSRTEYFYTSSDQLHLMKHYENGLISDSTVNISLKYSIHYFAAEKRRVIHQITDSTLTEISISGTDSIVHHHKIEIARQNVYDDDFYPGTYEKEIFIHDSLTSIDSCIFLGKNGDQNLVIVNKYDGFNHLLESDYYNKKDKSYKIYSSRYNSRMNMSYYMPVDNVARTYRIVREYNNQGLVSKETRISSSKKDPIITTYYEYSFFR